MKTSLGRLVLPLIVLLLAGTAFSDSIDGIKYYIDGAYFGQSPASAYTVVQNIRPAPVILSDFQITFDHPEYITQLFPISSTNPFLLTDQYDTSAFKFTYDLTKGPITGIFSFDVFDTSGSLLGTISQSFYVPEPSSSAMLVVGGLLLLRRFKPRRP